MTDANDPGSKIDELRKRNALHPNPGRVTSELFATSPFFDPHDAVQVKYEMLRRVRIDDQSVVRAVEEHGYTRPTFYEAKDAFEQDGIAGLLPKKRGPHSAHKLSIEIMKFVDELLDGRPLLNSRDIADEIFKRFDISVHPRSVERARARGKKR